MIKDMGKEDQKRDHINIVNPVDEGINTELYKPFQHLKKQFSELAIPGRVEIVTDDDIHESSRDLTTQANDGSEVNTDFDSEKSK